MCVCGEKKSGLHLNVWEERLGFRWCLNCVGRQAFPFFSAIIVEANEKHSYIAEYVQEALTLSV